MIYILFINNTAYCTGPEKLPRMAVFLINKGSLGSKSDVPQTKNHDIFAYAVCQNTKNEEICEILTDCYMKCDIFAGGHFSSSKNTEKYALSEKNSFHVLEELIKIKNPNKKQGLVVWVEQKENIELIIQKKYACLNLPLGVNSKKLKEIASEQYNILRKKKLSVDTPKDEGF